MRTSESITFCYLRSQGIKLLRWRLGHSPRAWQLPFPNRVHHFYARNRTPGAPKRFESQHWPHLAFHCAVILLYDIIEIFRVADNDSGLMNLVVMLNRRGIRPTLIDGNFLRQPL